MNFLATVMILITAMLSTTANPIEKRELGGVSHLSPLSQAHTCIKSAVLTHHPSLQVLLCTGAQATGNCTHTVVPLNECTNLTEPYIANTATFAPDGETQYCYPYLYSCGGICMSPEGCTYGAVSYNSTAKWNLTAAGGWNKLVQSYECFEGTAPSL